MGIFYTLNVFIMQFYLGAPMKSVTPAFGYFNAGIKAPSPAASKSQQYVPVE